MKLFSFSRTEKTRLSEWWWTIDRVLLTAVIILMFTGVVLVMAASPSVANRIGADTMHFVIRHMAILGVAFSLMIAVSFVSDERTLWRVATLALAGTIVAMVGVLIFGQEIKGAQRWIDLPGFSLQPSEFAKPALAVFIAWVIARQKEQPNFPGYLIAGIACFLVICLLLLQPDLGMTVVVTAIVAAQFFLAGLKFRYVAGFMLAAVVGMLLAYSVFDHVQSRINRFIDPDSGDNYQIEQSISAFQHGGFLGTGPGQGTVKLRIPDAHADFIFSVGAEEFGFLCIIALVGVYGFILWRGFQNLMNSSNLFTILACGGLLVMFGLQALIHMGSSMHLLPTKGMTLPFISYGGSSLLSMSFGFGMLLSLTRRSGKGSVAKTGLSGMTQGNRLWS